MISNNIYTKNIPDPDILIRPGGERRLSNFCCGRLLIVRFGIQMFYGLILEKNTLLKLY